jgi:hypothetical protein
MVKESQKEEISETGSEFQKDDASPARLSSFDHPKAEQPRKSIRNPEGNYDIYVGMTEPEILYPDAISANAAPRPTQS